MHVDKNSGISKNPDNVSSQPIAQNQQASLFGDGFPDKNNDGIVNSFDFDEDENIVKKLEEANLLGKLWNDVGNKVKSLLGNQSKNKTNKWIVQNNQTVTQIAVMILKQNKNNYTKSDVDNLSKQLVQMNKSKLDGTKKGFIVNSQILLPVEIDTTNEKTSKNPTYDYIFNTQTKRIRYITDRYNLIRQANNNSQILSDAKNLVNSFINEYGQLKSSSMEYLVLSPHFNPSKKSLDGIRNIRNDDYMLKASFGDDLSLSEELSSAVKKYKTANCAEISTLLAKLAFEKFGSRYKISQIIHSYKKDDGTIDSLKTHVALLLKETTSGEEYVIDNWINTKDGGIFFKDEWQTMIQQIYKDENSTIEVDEKYFEPFKKEGFFRALLITYGEDIPKEYQNNPYKFCHYVEQCVQMKKKLSENVMDIYCSFGLKDEIKKNHTQKKITKSNKSYFSFKNDFCNNMTVTKIQSFLNNNTSSKAMLVTLENNISSLIKDIDNATYGWGNGKNKKELIIPLINYIKNQANLSHISNEAVSNFEKICYKELNAHLYTDETRIITAFKDILHNLNKNYHERGYIAEYGTIKIHEL